jgi:metal-responsive CopG/Arc/MetJ family transcriptional regulator
METIQMTLDESLLKKIDRTVKRLKTTRSAFIRESVQQYLKTLDVQGKEAQHRAGYAKSPAIPGEFDIWESEQNWGD